MFRVTFLCHRSIANIPSSRQSNIISLSLNDAQLSIAVFTPHRSYSTVSKGFKAQACFLYCTSFVIIFLVSDEDLSSCIRIGIMRENSVLLHVL